MTIKKQKSDAFHASALKEAERKLGAARLNQADLEQAAKDGGKTSGVNQSREDLSEAVSVKTARHFLLRVGSYARMH